MKRDTRQRFDVYVAGEKTEIREKQTAVKQNADDTWYYFGLVGEIGFTIALPIAAGGIGGAYLDTFFGSSPKVTILLLLVGIGISFIGFFKIVEEVFHIRTH